MQVRDVLEMSKIAGFNRKLQLKPRDFHKTEVVVEHPEEGEGKARKKKKEEGVVKSCQYAEAIRVVNLFLLLLTTTTTTTAADAAMTAAVTGQQVKIVERCCELLVILKWGGDLTKLGERQAERLGEKFTKAMYPDPT